MADSSANLSDRALDFWSSVTDEYPDMEPDERMLLIELVRAIDESDMLRASVEDYGPLTAGSQDQLRINPAITALAAVRKTIVDLSKRLGLFEDDTTKLTPSQMSAKHAADARWGNERRQGRALRAVA